MQLDIKDFTTLGEHLRRLDLHENTVEVLALVEYFHASTHEGADQDDDGTVLGRIWAALKSYITSSENTDLEVTSSTWRTFRADAKGIYRSACPS